MKASDQKLYEYQAEIIQAVGHPVRLGYFGRAEA